MVAHVLVVMAYAVYVSFSKFIDFENIQNQIISNELCEFSVTLGCGGSSTENGTHFEVTGASDGPCNAKIYKASDDVVQVLQTTLKYEYMTFY